MRNHAEEIIAALEWIEALARPRPRARHLRVMR
jgi:hypothetical protein